jgi:hypothetical protein
MLGAYGDSESLLDTIFNCSPVITTECSNRFSLLSLEHPHCFHETKGKQQEQNCIKKFKTQGLLAEVEIPLLTIEPSTSGSEQGQESGATLSQILISMTTFSVQCTIKATASFFSGEKKYLCPGWYSFFFLEEIKSILIRLNY